jgi:hypothetical protein
VKEPISIRGEYERLGAQRFYLESGAAYRNPHEPEINAAINESLRRWTMDLNHVLDLAAGSGEITIALRKHHARQITGIDPFTFEAYEHRTGLKAERLSFEQISDGALAGRKYSLIACSFAMHLCEKSRLPSLATQLSLIAPAMLILTPHKRPMIRKEWGWTLADEFVVQRIRARMYNSGNTDGPRK